MERQRHHAHLTHHRVAPQDLHRHDQGVLHQIIVHGGVKDVHGPVVRPRGHERVGPVEGYRPHGLGMVFEGLVGERGEVQVEPDDAPVVGRDQDVVASRVDVKRADPLTPRQQLLHQDLFDQMVDSDVRLGGEEEEGFVGMEGDGLDLPVGLFEGALRLPPADLVDHHRLAARCRH